MAGNCCFLCPQIQVAPGGGYLFHSGYASLIDDSAFVVVGQQEGDNDFYYDRMLLREDSDFLSDLIFAGHEPVI